MEKEIQANSVNTKLEINAVKSEGILKKRESRDFERRNNSVSSSDRSSSRGKNKYERGRSQTPTSNRVVSIVVNRGIWQKTVSKNQNGRG